VKLYLCYPQSIFVIFTPVAVPSPSPGGCSVTGHRASGIAKATRVGVAQATQAQYYMHSTYSLFVAFPFFPTLKMAICRIYRRSGSVYSSDRAEKQQMAASSTFLLVADAAVVCFYGRF
jgi:hypothetical protein